MKTFPDSDNNEDLLDAVLGDDQWQATSEATRRAVSDSLRSRRRQRRIGQWTSGVVAAACLVAGVLSLVRPGGKTAAPVAAIQNVPVPSAKSKTLSREELVALFPKGSCIIAEINGRTKLVFFDKEIETRGFTVR